MRRQSVELKALRPPTAPVLDRRSLIQLLGSCGRAKRPLPAQATQYMVLNIVHEASSSSNEPLNSQGSLQ